MNREVPKGHRLFVTHYRRYVDYRGFEYTADINFNGDELQPNGGSTSAVLFDKKGNLIAESWADCSKRDNFCKRIGRDIAVGRLLKNVEAKRL